MPRSWPRSIIEAGVAIVQDAAGRVLVAERHSFQLSPGYWELPGGKLEPGETPAQGARRELFEEVGLEAEALEPFAVHDHAFATRLVRLHLFRVTRWRGTPIGREGQKVEWIDPAAPHVGPILPSNVRALAVLALPDLVFVTAAGPGGMAEVQALAPIAARKRRIAILVAEPTLLPSQRIVFARRLVAALSGTTTPVFVLGTPSEAASSGVRGLVSTAATLQRMVARPAVPLWLPLCQTSTDLSRAMALDADAVILEGGAGIQRTLPTAGPSKPFLIVRNANPQSAIAEARRLGAVGVVLPFDQVQALINARSDQHKALSAMTLERT